MAAAIVIPSEVLEGLEAVRRSGLTNMLDRPVVAELADSFGFPAAAGWVRGHRREYAEGSSAASGPADSAAAGSHRVSTRVYLATLATPASGQWT